MNSIKVITVDLSYRDTGICLAKISSEGLTITRANHIQNPKMEYGFYGLQKMATAMNNTIEVINGQINMWGPDIVIVEMPCFSQDAKSALCIGACWSAIGEIKNKVIVEPSLLKKWSGSVRGDGKKEVKNKVSSRCYLGAKELSNNNIVDAVGIALCFYDMIKQ